MDKLTAYPQKSCRTNVDVVGNDECVPETGYSPSGNVPTQVHTDHCLSSGNQCCFSIGGLEGAQLFWSVAKRAGRQMELFKGCLCIYMLTLSANDGSYRQAHRQHALADLGRLGVELFGHVLEPVSALVAAPMCKFAAPVLMQ